VRLARAHLMLPRQQARACISEQAMGRGFPWISDRHSALYAGIFHHRHFQTVSEANFRIVKKGGQPGRSVRHVLFHETHFEKDILP